MAITDAFLTQITILPSTLRSRELRKWQTSGGQGGIAGLVHVPITDGIRCIDADAVETVNTNTSRIASHIPEWLKTIINPVKKYAGFAWNAIKPFLPRSFSEAFTTLVTWGVQLYTFDWNATDAALKAQVLQNNQQMLVAAAGAAGTIAGWGAVRLLNMGVSKMFKKGTVPLTSQQGRDRSLDIKIPVITGRAAVASALEEESNDEMRGALRSLLAQVKQIQTRNMFLGFMLHSRTNRWFGQEPITQQQPSATFAGKVEERIKRLPDWLQAPAENFLEEFGEAFMEGGFIWASDADSQYHMARMAVQDAQGPERTISFQPNHENTERNYVISGSQQFVEEEAARVYNSEVLLHRKDVGEWVGERLEDTIRRAALQRQLTIRFSTHKFPGMLTGEPPIYSEVTIPRVDLNLTWEQIKAAADEFQKGTPFTKITWKCYQGAEFVGNLVVTGDTKQECERRMKKLKPLMPSTIQLRQPSVSFADEENPLFRNGRKKFYPLEATLLVQQNSTEDLERRRRGRKSLAYPDQPKFREQTKVELWTQTKPPGFNGFRAGT